MANASSCFTPLRVVACCCKDCILARQAPRERRPQTPHSLPSLFCLFYPTIAIATLQSLNPENATPTSKQPKLCTLSLQKKTREREGSVSFAQTSGRIYNITNRGKSRKMRKHAIYRTSANEDLAKKDSSHFQEFMLFSQELYEIDWRQSTLSDVSSSAASIDEDREVEVLFTSQNTGSSVLLSLTKTTKDLRLQQVYADIRKMPKRFVLYWSMYWRIVQTVLEL